MAREATSEALRLRALASCAILDTPPEARFDEIAQLAAQICGTKSALVTLVDETRQWFKARVGFAGTETPRDIALCNWTIQGTELFVVPDTLADPRFVRTPLVVEQPKIRFYAGAPLILTAGQAIGSLAVLDDEPRQLDASQRTALEILSRQVVAQIELRNRVAASRERQALAATLIDAAMDCVIAIDHENKIIEFNPAAERTFGWTRDQVLGRDMTELIVPHANREAHRAGLERHLATGIQRNLGRRLELGALRADGTEVPVEVSISRVEIEPPIFAGFIRDLSSYRETARELQRNIERFELVARATNDVIYDWDLRSNDVWWSEAFARAYGDPLEGSGTAFDRWLARVHPDERERVDVSLRDAIARGASWSDEYRFRRPDGTFATVFDRGYVMADQEGRAIRMIGALVDLTERRRLEDQLVRAQKMEAIGQLAGGIAHDFNNILTIIECNAYTLGNTASADLTTYVDEISEACQRAAALTRQLLLVSRKQAPRRELASLNDLVSQFLRMLRRVLGEHIEVQTSFHTSLPPVSVDVGMIEQVLLNLAVNARDAMPRGGKLAISTGVRDLRAPTSVQGVQLSPGRHVSLRVSDTGAGIPEDVLPRIFEPFFTTKEIGKGTGLGLSTVFGIVRQHRGAVEVQSTPGNGSSFTVYLPAASGDSLARPRVAMAATPTGTETLLLVEDEPAVRTSLAQFLRRLGYDVLVASSAVAAAELWRGRRDQIALVITDIVMPGGMSGFDLAAMLRAESPTLPVIFSSGYQEPQPHDLPPLVEGENFLPKPYAPILLARLIRKRLDP